MDYKYKASGEIRSIIIKKSSFDIWDKKERIDNRGQIAWDWANFKESKEKFI
jgi:hypothetical protein